MNHTVKRHHEIEGPSGNGDKKEDKLENNCNGIPNYDVLYKGQLFIKNNNVSYCIYQDGGHSGHSGHSGLEGV